MRFRCIVAAAALGAAGAAAAAAGELLYFQTNDGQSTYGPGHLWTASGVDCEIADDFELSATLDRVVAGGFIFGVTPQWEGAYVRFYERLPDGTPGPMQREYFLAAGDPDLTVNDVGLVDARLSPPFDAQGRHFLCVQPVVNSWYWWSAETGAPRGQSFFFRDRAAGQTAWQHGDNQPFSNPDADVEFWLYGTVSAPGIVDSLSAVTLSRSGYLEIFGSNFGSAGTVLVGGVAAPIADWTSPRIVAHVPEAAPLGDTSVQVVTPGGASNVLPLHVTTRLPDGRVSWRLRMEGSYAMVRPARGPDGTIYAIDVYSRLYAVAPDGGVKWIVRGAGNKGLAVDADGMIYVGSESDVKSFDPDGTLRWAFVQDPRAFILLGLAVGPDGNIYGVATEGLGVFSLTPAGALRWTNPESYRRPIVDYGEIAFGPNGSHDQLYFYANDHTRAVRLDNGASVFTIASLRGLPVVSPSDGTMHVRNQAYSPDGQLLWSFAFSGTVSAAEMAADGTHYVVHRGFELYALQPDGTERWHASVANPVGPPNVDPTGALVVMGRSGVLNEPGFVQAVHTSSRVEAWRVELPPEEPTVFNPWTAQYGFHQFVDTRVRFTPDGSAAYLVTAIATGGLVRDRCFLYCLATGLVPPGSSTGTSEVAVLRPLRIEVAPNPSRDGAMLHFELSTAETIRMRIYDVTGRLVRELGPRRVSAGSQFLWWDGRDAGGVRAPAGVFLAKVVAGSREASAKILRMR